MAKEVKVNHNRKHKLRYRCSFRLHGQNWANKMTQYWYEYVDKYGCKYGKRSSFTVVNAEDLQRLEAKWEKRQQEIKEHLIGHQAWHERHWEKLIKDGIIQN